MSQCTFFYEVFNHLPESKMAKYYIRNLIYPQFLDVRIERFNYFSVSSLQLTTAIHYYSCLMAEKRFMHGFRRTFVIDGVLSIPSYNKVKISSCLTQKLNIQYNF